MCFLCYYLITNPSAQVGCDTRSVFKQSLKGLNSDFSLFKTGYRTKAKEPSLLNYLLVARGRIIGFIPFLKIFVLCYYVKYNQPHAGFKLVWLCSFLTTITIIPRAPLLLVYLLVHKNLSGTSSK